MYSRATNTIALKKIMVEKGLDKISDLSRATGINRNTLGNVLRGSTQPSADVIMRLVTTLDVPPTHAGEIFLAQIYVIRKLFVRRPLRRPHLLYYTRGLAYDSKTTTNRNKGYICPFPKCKKLNAGHFDPYLLWQK